MLEEVSVESSREWWCYKTALGLNDDYSDREAYGEEMHDWEMAKALVSTERTDNPDMTQQEQSIIQ